MTFNVTAPRDRFLREVSPTLVIYQLPQQIFVIRTFSVLVDKSFVRFCIHVECRLWSSGSSLARTSGILRRTPGRPPFHPSSILTKVSALLTCPPASRSTFSVPTVRYARTCSEGFAPSPLSLPLSLPSSPLSHLSLLSPPLPPPPSSSLLSLPSPHVGLTVH